DEDGNDAVKYETYSPTEVFTEYAAGKTMIASYSTIDVVSERTEVAETDVDDSDQSTDNAASTTGGADAGLQIASIIIALVLVAVLVVIGIRMVLKKTKKSKGSTETYYSRDSRERAQQQINANKARREAAAKARMEQAKAEEAKPAEKPAEEAPAEEATAEEAPADEATAEETPDSGEEAEQPVKEYDYDNPENNI
ncbi:MAG: hypothetical protein ILP02_04150, partial [Clostridia bacterium]|nr:hypothetical protein [Clostridia bacterium]